MANSGPAEKPANPATEQQQDSNTGPAGITIALNDANMRSSYANVCNVLSSKEEVTLLFGTNRTWHTAGKQHTIDLSDRIILNPLVAKRLNKLLSSVLAEYEQKFGELTL